MIPMAQVQSGIAKFIDRDIVPALNGWDKVLVGGGGALLVKNLPSTLSKYMSSPVVAAMGIYDMTSNKVDIDAAYQAAKPYMGADPMPVKIPLMGITIKIGKKEIDTLCAYIKEEV